MRISAIAGILSTPAILAVVVATSAHSAPDAIEVSPDGSRAPAPGSPDNFTGTAHSTPLFDSTDYSDMSGGEVSFERGARTAWHSHPAGQTYRN